MEPCVPDRRSSALFLGVEACFPEDEATTFGVEVSILLGLGSFLSFPGLDNSPGFDAVCVPSIEVSV